MTRQASSQTQTMVYEVQPREAAQALDIEFFEDSYVSAAVKGGNIVLTVKTDRKQVQEEVSYDG